MLHELCICLRFEGAIFLIACGLCIPAANWLIGDAGLTCIPQGPCIIPVVLGIMTTSGFLVAG